MAIFECGVCKYRYDEKDGLWEKLPKDWVCPVCKSGKDVFKEITEDITIDTGDGEIEVEVKKKPGYLSNWRRKKDEFEELYADIHKMADTGKSVSEPMRTKKKVINFDHILIKGGQLAKMPLDKHEKVNSKTVIGPKAKIPLVIDTPIYISHMSFGALSKEVKIAMSKGASAAKTAICSGEGGILPDEKKASFKYIFEYVPNKYSVTEKNLMEVDAIEIKFGQSTKPGMGGHLPGKKVTEEIAKIRDKEVGKGIHSPTYFQEITSKEELRDKIDDLRKRSGGRPIGVKIAAGHIEDDLDFIIFAKPDFITIDGRGGATGSSPKFVKDSTSIPTIFALRRARRFLDKKGIKDISLVITGGLRVSSDFAKALCLGADAVALATSIMIAAGCQQYRICNTGNCPVGIATHDPELRKRLDIDVSAKRVENFLRVSTEELEDFARLTGNDDVHKLSIRDICTTNSEISDHSDIEHVGGKNE